VFGVVLVGDPGSGEGLLQPARARPGVVGSADTAELTYVERQAGVRVPQPLQVGIVAEARDVYVTTMSTGKPTCPLLEPVRRARAAEKTRSHHATAVPSSSTIWPGIARRVTPSIVVVGATLAAPSRPASTP
jgi:hypothetical protein